MAKYQANTLAELILMNETQLAHEKIGQRQSHNHDLQRDLEDITEMFLTTTRLGEVVTKEGLRAKALHTYRATDVEDGWNGIEIILQEGISHYITMPRFYESGSSYGIWNVSVQQWPNFFDETITLLQWLSRARKMLQDNTWVPLNNHEGS